MRMLCIENYQFERFLIFNLIFSETSAVLKNRDFTGCISVKPKQTESCSVWSFNCQAWTDRLTFPNKPVQFNPIQQLKMRICILILNLVLSLVINLTHRLLVYKVYLSFSSFRWPHSCFLMNLKN